MIAVPVHDTLVKVLLREIHLNNETDGAEYT